MTQTVPATCVLGPGKTGLTIGLRVLNLDGTTYAAFSATGVAETSVAGTYRKTGGVVVPHDGAYIVWGTAVTDYAEAMVESTSDVAAIKAKTDNLPASPAATGDIPSASANATAAAAAILATPANKLTTDATGASAANVTSLKGTVLTETSAGQLAAALSKFLDVPSPVLTAASVNQTGDAYASIGAAGAGLTALGDTRLANLDAAISTRAAAGSAMTLADDAITSAKFDEVTAFPLKQADTGSSAVARTGSDGDTLETLSDQLDATGAGGLYSETITIDDGTNPLDGVRVLMCTDAGRTNIIRSGYTDTNGQWVFRVDATGTYYGRAEISEFNTQDFTVVISA